VEGLSEAMAMELEPLGIKVTVVEPGFFRTDFLDASSLVATRDRIDDYAATVGAMRDFAAGVNHAQPGDPLNWPAPCCNWPTATRRQPACNWVRTR
jgi:NAD(P)-dependent dehydrogenase (short-subunit alcohol dehydrogenase family)